MSRPEEAGQAPGLVPDNAADDEFVTVFATGARDQLEMVKLALRRADVPYSVINEDVVSWFPHLGQGLLMQVQVLASHAAEAQRALGELPQSLGGLTERLVLPSQLRVRLNPIRAEQRLREALARPDSGMRAREGGDWVSFRPMAWPGLGLPCRVAFLPTEGGSAVRVRFGTPKLLRLGGGLAFVGLLASAFSDVGTAGARGLSDVLGLLGAAGIVVGLAAGSLGLFAGLRQRKRVWSFLHRTFDDVAIPASEEDGGGQ